MLFVRVLTRAYVVTSQSIPEQLFHYLAEQECARRQMSAACIEVVSQCVDVAAIDELILHCDRFSVHSRQPHREPPILSSRRGKRSNERLRPRLIERIACGLLPAAA